MDYRLLGPSWLSGSPRLDLDSITDLLEHSPIHPITGLGSWCISITSCGRLVSGSTSLVIQILVSALLHFDPCLLYAGPQTRS